MSYINSLLSFIYGKEVHYKSFVSNCYIGFLVLFSAIGYAKTDESLVLYLSLMMTGMRQLTVPSMGTMAPMFLKEIGLRENMVKL